jgi:radical SAM protein with 4Fe4S-binding SPASM domain
MCGFGKEANPVNKNKFMPFDRYKIIISQIGEKTNIVRLNGRGESTIHPKFVKILEYTKSKFSNIGINLFSNFSFNNSKIIKSLINNQVQLFLSIDSTTYQELSAIRKGANFMLIDKNIQQLHKLSNRPFIVFTIQEKNICRIFDIAQYAFKNNCQIIFNSVRRDIGIETFIDVVNENYSLILEQFDKVNELYKSSQLQCLIPDQLAGVDLKVQKSIQTHGKMLKCPALDNELCILFDGTLTPCNMFNPYEYGNIFVQSLDEIWEGRRRIEFLDIHKNYYYCKNCANLGV